MAALTTEQQTKILQRLNRLIPEENDNDLVNQLIEDAADQLLAFTHRNKIPDGLVKSVGDLALIAYNRLGTEGEKGRSEAGESYQFDDMPDSIYRIAQGYRIARVGGNAHESTDEEDET